MLLRLVLLVTVAALLLGVAAIVAFSRRDRRAQAAQAARLVIAERKLRIAQSGLRRIANNTAADPAVEASLALDEMDILDTQEISR